MDNLQTAMMDAEWARREGERRQYRVLPPAAPGAVSYHMALALVADRSGRDDLAQASLDAAEQAAVEAEIERYEADCRQIGEEYTRRVMVSEFAAWLDSELVYVQPYQGDATNASNLVEQYLASLGGV